MMDLIRFSDSKYFSADELVVAGLSPRLHRRNPAYAEAL
jgi:hypothetical protein